MNMGKIQFRCTSEVEAQRKYYAESATMYEAMHIQEKDEHFLALSLLIAVLNYLEINSILDVGSGTGRAIAFIKEKRTDVRIIGVEPIKELREVGYKKGLSKDELIDGNALNLSFEDGEFDLVCEFAMLHHVRKPEIAISEMLRVAKRAIFISDSNNFGQGSLFTRSIKQLIQILGLWKVADIIKTKGRGYTISEGDGLAYSYSVFNNFKQIQKDCRSVHLMNTQNAGSNLFRTASHIAIVGIKK